jgi:hypothetical protein
MKYFIGDKIRVVHKGRYACGKTGVIVNIRGGPFFEYGIIFDSTTDMMRTSYRATFGGLCPLGFGKYLDNSDIVLAEPSENRR